MADPCGSDIGSGTPPATPTNHHSSVTGSSSSIPAIVARTAFQIFRDEHEYGTVAIFNALSSDVVLPYKIRAAEEALLATLDFLDSHTHDCQRYVIFALHAASTYLSLLVCFTPRMVRCLSVDCIETNRDALERLVRLYPGGPDEERGSCSLLTQRVRELAAVPHTDRVVPLGVLSRVEEAVVAAEREYRQHAKECGVRVEGLRKVAPERAASPTRPCASLCVARPLPSERGAQNGVEEDGSAIMTPVCAAATTRGGSPLRAEKGHGATGGGGAEEDTRPADMDTDTTEKAHAAPATRSPTGAVGSVSRATKTGPTEGKDGEGIAAPVVVVVPPVRARRRAAPNAVGAAAGGVLRCGRLRTLCASERRVVSRLRDLIHLLAHVVATRYNTLIPVLDHIAAAVQSLREMIQRERDGLAARPAAESAETSDASSSAATAAVVSAVPFHTVDLAPIDAAVQRAIAAFRDDVADCRVELDEDLLHPIAHACLTAINHVEGYDTAAFVPPPAAVRQERAAARALVRQRQEAVARRAAARVAAREALAAAQRRNRQLVTRRLHALVASVTLASEANSTATSACILGGGGDGAATSADGCACVEDRSVPQPSALHAVSYDPAHVPGLRLFDRIEHFEQALTVWCMIVSVPRVLQLPQMSFPLFARALRLDDEDRNGAMEDLVQRVVGLCVEEQRLRVPQRARQLAAALRGRSWFGVLVEFVAAAASDYSTARAPERRGRTAGGGGTAHNASAPRSKTTSALAAPAQRSARATRHTRPSTGATRDPRARAARAPPHPRRPSSSSSSSSLSAWDSSELVSETDDDETTTSSSSSSSSRCRAERTEEQEELEQILGDAGSAKVAEHNAPAGGDKATDAVADVPPRSVDTFTTGEDGREARAATGRNSDEEFDEQDGGDEKTDEDQFRSALMASVGRAVNLRPRAAWGGTPMSDRLNLLQFAVMQWIHTEKVQAEASRLRTEEEEMRTALDKALREAVDETRRRMTVWWKSRNRRGATCTTDTTKVARMDVKDEETGDDDTHRGAVDSAKVLKQDGDGKDGVSQDSPQEMNFEEEREDIIRNAETKRVAACVRYFGQREKRDRGALIQPLGSDRYRRLYWYFPLGTCIHVQTPATVAQSESMLEISAQSEETTAATTSSMEQATPVNQSTSHSLGSVTMAAPGWRHRLLDDDTTGDGVKVHDTARRTLSLTRTTSPDTSAARSGQWIWGVIDIPHLPAFIRSLDTRGEREYRLYAALEEICPYLQKQQQLQMAPRDATSHVVMTRSRTSNLNLFDKMRLA